MDENAEETRMRGWRLPPPMRPDPAAGQEEVPAGAWLERPARGADVRGCYRYLLGREPENEEVVSRHLEGSPSIATLRRRFMASGEFRAQVGEPLAAGAADSAAAPSAEVAVTEEELDKLLLWQARTWTRLGEEAPHYSVLPEDRFVPELFEASRREFYATGAADAALVIEALGRHGLGPEQLPVLCEFGCGVGRVSLHLAGLFPELTCIDISAPHLAAARAEAARLGMTHITWNRAKRGQPMPAEDYDVWLSQGTLQWNPPPLIHAVLRQAFAGLAAGGVALFELPVWRGGYRFGLAEYLDHPAPARPAAHLLPPVELFALLAESGMRLLEVREAPPRPGQPAGCQAPLFVARKAG